MSGLTNDEISNSMPYLLSVMILVVIVLVYQIYYIITPKITYLQSQVAKTIEGVGPSLLGELSDRGPAGTVGLYGAENILTEFNLVKKDGFLGNAEPPVFWGEGDESAYRQQTRGKDADASATYWECPQPRNADGSCPVALVEMSTDGRGGKPIRNEGMGAWKPLGNSGFGRRESMKGDKIERAIAAQMGHGRY